MFMVLEPWLSVAEAYVFLVYGFLLWFVLFRLASGADRVHGSDLLRLIAPLGLMVLSALGFAWVGPTVVFSYFGDSVETGWGFILSDIARLGAAVAAVAAFVWYVRTRGTQAFVGRVPSWVVLVVGALLTAAMLVVNAFEPGLLEYSVSPAPMLEYPVLFFVLNIVAAASVLSALAVRLIRARSTGAVLPSAHQ